jgi:hypothetical protein
VLWREPAQQRCESLRGAIDRVVRVRATGTSRNRVRKPQIEAYDAEEGVSITGVFSEGDIGYANKIFVARDAGKNAVLRVRLELVPDPVAAGDPDLHAADTGKLRAMMLSGQFVLFHLAPECHGADAQRLGGFFPITVIELESPSDQFPFLGAKIQRIAGEGTSLAL